MFGNNTQEMKERWNVPASRPLADFAPTLILKAKDFATEITIHNAREQQMRNEAHISREHVANNQAVRQTFSDAAFIPKTCGPKKTSGKSSAVWRPRTRNR